MRFPFIREIGSIVRGEGTPTALTGAPGARSAEPSGGPYPVRLDGRIDPDTSRWLWLVKFILIIPHAIVLALLWIAVTLLTVVAGVTILFTGRYPPRIFAFNTGVMLWTWRVTYYTTASFATDRYPPFSLAPDPSYPADLVIEYPGPLSRWQVLVKWWLLAFPHLVIVGILAGGWGIGWPGGWRIAGAGGLIAVLAVIAAVIRAVRGAYPPQLFDLIMGFNRWVYRVLAYVALMTDQYPPFRLDQGGTDPAERPAPRPPTWPLSVRGPIVPGPSH